MSTPNVPTSTMNTGRIVDESIALEPIPLSRYASVLEMAQERSISNIILEILDTGRPSRFSITRLTNIIFGRACLELLQRRFETETLRDRLDLLHGTTILRRCARRLTRIWALRPDRVTIEYNLR